MFLALCLKEITVDSLFLRVLTSAIHPFRIKLRECEIANAESLSIKIAMSLQKIKARYASRDFTRILMHRV